MNKENQSEGIIAQSPGGNLILFSDRIEFSKNSGIDRAPLMLSDFSYYRLNNIRNPFIILLVHGLGFVFGKNIFEKIYLDFFSGEGSTNSDAYPESYYNVYRDLQQSAMELQRLEAEKYGWIVGALITIVLYAVLEYYGYTKKTKLDFFDDHGEVFSFSFPYRKRSELGYFTDEIDKAISAANQNKKTG
jgi:hypothetical protein